MDLDQAEQNLLMDPTGITRLGQQDCKDFFICLTENRQHWHDVFELFKVDSVSSTTCTICNHESTQDQGTTQSTFLMFDVPNDNVPISTFIEELCGGNRPMER